MHRFLAQEMVDPINLMLLQGFEDVGVESLGRCKVVPKGLLDHDPAPLATFFHDQPSGSKRRDHRAEEAIGDREIEKTVAGGAARPADLPQMPPEPPTGAGTVQVPLHKAHSIAQPPPATQV